MPDNFKPREVSTTTLLDQAELAVIPFIASRLPGVTIDVLPSTTETDRKVAAAAFGLSAEATGDPTVDPKNWERQAHASMALGGAVVEIIYSDQNKTGESMFWRELSQAVRR